MVERPIKKSERQAVEAGATEQSEQQAEVRSERQPPSPPNKDKDRPARSKGRDDRKRGDRDRKEEVSKPPAMMALMRGPRPVQPKPVVEEPLEEVQETVSEEGATEEVVTAESLTDETSAPES